MDKIDQIAKKYKKTIPLKVELADIETTLYAMPEILIQLHVDDFHLMDCWSVE